MQCCRCVSSSIDARLVSLVCLAQKGSVVACKCSFERAIKRLTEYIDIHSRIATRRVIVWKVSMRCSVKLSVIAHIANCV